MLKRKELLVLVVSPYTYLCYLKHEDFLWNASLFISKNIMYLFMCSFELQLLWETKSQLLQVAFWDVAEDSESVSLSSSPVANRIIVEHHFS